MKAHAADWFCQRNFTRSRRAAVVGRSLRDLHAYLRSAIVVSKWSTHGDTQLRSTTEAFESTVSQINSLNADSCSLPCVSRVKVSGAALA